MGQRWELKESHLVADDGKCLDIQGPSTDNGTPLPSVDVSGCPPTPMAHLLRPGWMLDNLLGLLHE